METDIVVAYLTAGVSLVCVLVNVLLTRASERKARRHESRMEGLKSDLEKEVKRLEAQLADSNSERSARRDYEYEARKRLYAEVEPILFQLVELSESALHRIYSLARTARHGNLSDPKTSWLASDEEGYYYFHSTIYHLLAPIAAVKLLQRRITFVDLSVEKSIAAEYALAKRLLISFTDDFEFARFDPELKYDPNADALDGPEEKTLLRKAPDIYWRQGVFIGMIEGCAEALLAEAAEGRPARVKSFCEVELERLKEDSAWSRALGEVRYLLLHFHPAKRPVFWRLLITQACIYRTFVALREAKLAGLPPPAKPLKLIPEAERAKLDWRGQPDEAPDEDVFKKPFAAANQYFQKFAPDLLDHPKP